MTEKLENLMRAFSAYHEELLRTAVRAVLDTPVEPNTARLADGQPIGSSPTLAWAELPTGQTGEALRGLLESMRMVEAFHVKCRVAETQRLPSIGASELADESLHMACSTLSRVAEAMCALMRGVDDKDRRPLRAHLIVEETAELLGAMADRDEVKTLDAMADLLYVLLGSAVTMDLPLAEAFVEVHRSNMTKQRQPDDQDGARVRDKGPDYVAPDLEGVLSVYRRTPRPLAYSHWPAVSAQANPCAELRGKLEDPEQGPGSYGDAPNRHNPHLMSENAECVYCGMTEYAIISQRNRVGKPKCTGMPGA